MSGLSIAGVAIAAAAALAAGWTTYGGDAGQQRFSSLTEVHRSNVGRLQPRWRVRLDGSGVGEQYSGAAQPIISDGRMFIVTGADDVFALDAETGERLWRYQARLDPAIDTICCGWTSRGVGLGGGKVYVGQLDGKLVALDERTGSVIWSVQAERWQEGYTITSAPLFHDGLVITGFAGAENATRGRVKAYDTEDGSLVWTFYTVPAPGEAGHETWPQDSDAWRHGGATVWQTPAVDADLGLIYFQTANPNPDFNGAVRPGDNLFSVSVVALEAKTGRYRWHFQMVRHDIWDYDGSNPVVLFDALIRGKKRKGLAAAGKTGWVYLLDRVTGEPLLPIEERAVPQEPRQATAKTQPVPTGDAFVPQEIDIAPEGFDLVDHGRIFTPFWTTPRVMKPSPGGGANWPPSSFDPRTGLLYVCANDSVGVFQADSETDTDPRPGDERHGGPRKRSGLPPGGILAAMDVTTNRIVWRQRWPETCYSGSTVTAGGLLFIGRSDGRITALDSADGRLLWEFQTDAGVNAPPAVYSIKGRQYLAIYSAGSLFARSKRGDSVWTFALGGGGAAVPPSTAVTTVPSIAVELDGKTLYRRLCIYCHGGTGQGGHSGMPLSRVRDREAALHVIKEGRGQMPAFKDSLRDEQLAALADYINSAFAE